MHIIAATPTMMHMSAGEIGMLKLFKQLVPSPFGRHENDLEINTLCPNSVRFTGRVCKAIWYADYRWDVIEFAFSYTGREQTEQRPWRREKYTRIGPMFWICEQESRNIIYCTCGGAHGPWRALGQCNLPPRPRTRKLATGIHGYIWAGRIIHSSGRHEQFHLTS